MPTANSGQSQLAYEAEAVWGTTVGSAFLLLRKTGFSINTEKSNFVSEERRFDGQIPYLRHGVSMGRGSVDFELGYLTLKDFMRSFLRTPLSGTGSGALNEAIDHSANNVTFVLAAKTITRASGSWLTENAKVGMKIRLATPLNTAVVTVASVVALVITVVEATLVDETLATGTYDYIGDYAENGVTDTSFSIEEQFTDEALYDIFTGVYVDTLSLDIPTEGIVTGSMGLVSKKGTMGSISMASPTDVDTGDAVSSLGGTIDEGGAVLAIVTGMDISMAWGWQDTRVVGDSDIQELNPDRLEVTGNLRALFQNSTTLDKFRDETVSSLRMALQDAAGNEFNLFLPEIKYTGEDKPSSAGSNIILSLPFQATMDGVTGNTVELNMIPA